MFRAYLVEDELPAAKRLARLLQATGRVQIVGTEMNPAAAIEAIQLASPDILFLDIQMPGLTGFELLDGSSDSRSLYSPRLTTSMR
jgi:two-component system LytT family response regulator